MFAIIESLEPILPCPLPAFTEPSFRTHLQVFLGWIMCLGWFRDAVASTAKRVATASGNHWVVIGLAI